VRRFILIFFSEKPFGGAISPVRDFMREVCRERARKRDLLRHSSSRTVSSGALARKNPLMAETRRATSMSARETPTARMGATTSMNIITLEATDEDSAVRASTPLSALCRAFALSPLARVICSFPSARPFPVSPTGPRRRSPDLPSPAPNSRPTRALS
jgi:hypothetical protein